MIVRLLLVFVILFLTACDSYLTGLLGIGSSEEVLILSIENTTVSVERSWTVKGAGAKLTIATRDQNGGLFYGSGSNITASYSGGTSKGWFSEIINNGNGVYNLDFVGSQIGTAINIEVKVNGESVVISQPQITVISHRLAFTGNSSPLSSATNRVFSELDGGFTITGECDVELGDVTISGNIVNSGALTTPCISNGGGTFSLFLNYDTTEPYVNLSNGKLMAEVKAAQSTMKEVETIIYKINSANPPVTVSNLAEFQGITCNDPTAFYILVNDIDVAAEFGSSTNNWVPICLGAIDYFEGVFEGNNFTVSNIHRTAGSSNYMGVWSKTFNSQIVNLNMYNISIMGGQYVGGLVGLGNSDTFRNIHITGSTITANNYTAGGLVGRGSGVHIYKSSFSGAVSGTNRIGGMFGELRSFGSCMRCDSTGTVTGTDNYVGGIAGENLGKIQNSSSSATVIGTDYAGGLVGKNDGSWGTNSSFFTGSVSGNNYVGGLVGTTSSPLTNCYFSGSVSVNVSGGSPIWGEQTGPVLTEGDSIYYLSTATCSGCDQDASFASRTEDELKTQSNYINWDFYKIFEIDEGTNMPTHQ